MVKANALWHSTQHSNRQLPDLNRMSTLLETRQQECLPLPETTAPRLQNPRTECKDEAGRQLHGFPSNFHASGPTTRPYFEGKKFALPCGLHGTADLKANFPGIWHKGFVIFDQSENQTRLICNYFGPTIQTPSIAKANLFSGNEEPLKVGRPGHTDQIDSTNEIFCDASAANDESEMHEDTEEINALLDSDGEEDSDGKKSVDDDDDEVTSTDHSPIQKRELVSELVEEVASSDGPNKRQKKLDGGYIKSSLVNTASSVKLDESHEYENDAKSGYHVDGPTGIKVSDCTFGIKRPKKDKIREILGVLERIIPGVKGKDPLFVIDEAIDYLRIAKIKAETLGVSFH